MKRIINSIVPHCFEREDGLPLFRVQFYFNDHPSEFFVIEETLWLAILKKAKDQAHIVSWNELKNEIYYSVVMGTAEISPTA